MVWEKHWNDLTVTGSNLRLAYLLFKERSNEDLTPLFLGAGGGGLGIWPSDNHRRYVRGCKNRNKAIFPWRSFLHLPVIVDPDGKQNGEAVKGNAHEIIPYTDKFMVVLLFT